MSTNQIHVQITVPAGVTLTAELPGRASADQIRTALNRLTEAVIAYQHGPQPDAVPGDEDTLAAVRALPREADGFVNVNKVRTTLGCNRNRAVRLLAEVGLLRPADAAKHLSN
ncbi:hypothetical protein [Streptomyces lavendulae]|uniref:hypothetical protein n=1 Tax=Streptomyces lavendulae TaxID=1914 RepID=UPI0038300C83